MLQRIFVVLFTIVMLASALLGMAAMGLGVWVVVMEFMGA